VSQILIQGLLLSGLYALIAIGFTLIFSVGRVLNLAYGAYLMLGAYAYFWLVQVQGLPQPVGMLGAVAVGVTAGVLKYRLIVRPLRNETVPVEIATLILAVVLQSAMILLFNASPKVLLPIVPGVWTVGGATVTANILTATLASWVILLSLFLFIRQSHAGRAIAAVSQDARGAAVAGIDAVRVNLLTWAISGGLGAVAGVFFASYTQISPTMWVSPLIIAVAVVIVGGVGSILGTLVVAHVIGFMEIMVSSLIAPELRGIFTMALIIGVLVIRPRGLFGRGDI
jgi:branched-chain amino acid transport system permease protein